ncbi:MAG TPA: HlyU family transcriptional regulator [Desulfurivibrionaceae bacterium]|nr:HlyU family transcriptional regulator [Desulfurivibrionaceae bacterium]
MLKKLLSGLLGLGNDTSAGPPASPPVEYKGYLIVSEPEDLGGQLRVSGWIRKPLAGQGQDAADSGAGETLEVRFDRSDMVADREACDEMMIRKAQRYIDEVGDGIFGAR